MKKKGKHWLRKRICVHPMHKTTVLNAFGTNSEPVNDHWHTVKTFDYPSWIQSKWSWYVDYWYARIKVRFPRHHVSIRVYGYWPEAEADTETQKKRQLAAAKAQVTKIENLINHRRRELSAQLFQDETTDPVMIRATQKLDEKKFKLEQLVND
ncbi:MAG: hypothetical protein AB7U05_09135 [Mangrovibacterium sp.]